MLRKSHSMIVSNLAALPPPPACPLSRQCIEILERLNAANLGSGEIGEVKVEKVVEVLLSEW